MHTLYHYVHCPFCLRVRMALGYLEIPYVSKVLAYDDEKTPASLGKQKMLPIVKFSNGKIVNESLDIISILDEKDLLETRSTLARELDGIERILAKISPPMHSLIMPYWASTIEFSPTARQYFLSKQEKKRGPFYQLVGKKRQFMAQTAQILEELEALLTPYFRKKALSLQDILLASHLWGLYVVPEFQFSTKMHHYLQRVGLECRFDYHQDFWPKPGGQ